MADSTDIDPISIFLVKKGCGSDRLLFRYPYANPTRPSNNGAGPTSSGGGSGVTTAAIPTANPGVDCQRVEPPGASSTTFAPSVSNEGLYLIPNRNPYALSPGMLARDPYLQPTAAAAAMQAASVSGDTGPPSGPAKDLLKPETLTGFSSRVLSYLFAVHSGLCDQKFELKVSEVRFIGHAMSLEVNQDEARYYANKTKSPLTMFNLVFALRATAPYSVVECYHDLSRHIGAAIRNEERRVGYLTAEAKTMDEAADHASSMPEDTRVSAFELAQDRSQLAKDLKEIYESMRYSGSVYLRINKYIEVNFCVPQKVFNRLNPSLEVEPQAVFDCLEFLKPYHTFLLLHEPEDLLSQLPLDGSPPLYKLVRAANPTMSFRALASETMIPLVHIFELAGHLLYWGKATVIYPVCENNVYIISPKISNVLTPVIKERFAEKFPGENYVQMLSMFNSPFSISHRTHFHNPASVQLLGKIVVFFLQQHLIVQIHTYVTLCLNGDCTLDLEDPVRKKFGLPWCVARHLGFDASAAKGTGGNIRHVALPSVDGESKTNGDHSSEDPAIEIEDLDSIHEILNIFKEEDRKTIIKGAIPCTKGEDYKLFARVAPYFNGRYHLEEILYFANLRRSELTRLMDCFIDILTFHEHEDPAITSYYDKSVRTNGRK